MTKELKSTKYILKRARNGRKREATAATRLYKREKEILKREADAYAQKFLGHKRMSLSAYIHIKTLLPSTI